MLVGALALPCTGLHAQQAETAQEIGADEAPAADLPQPTALEWSLLAPEIPLNSDKAVKYRTPTTSTGDTASWDRTDKGGGASAMTVKQSVLPFADAKVGADLNVAGQTPATSSDMVTGKMSGDSYQSTGSAWANMTAPGLGNIWDKTTVEARVDPTQEQSKVGTSISKSVPLGGQQYSLSAQTGYNVIQSAVPMVGADGRVAKGAIETDHSAKLEFKDSGTSLLAGETMSTMDEKWLRRVGVEQKMFGGISVTGAVSETPTGTPNRSLTAGFKHSW
ncbi:MAG: hypothetical protein K2X60_13120 [Xanthobacteraceae bacterium]|nr:hypothetical protein [Xanthobacteraceae bacterium]